jgi:choline monooxygenase
METLPASAYRDPAAYEAERRGVFGREWLVFARGDEVASPATSVVRTVAGYPLVVVRDAQGGLRGFHNVCRHRAAPVAAEGSASCRGGLVCGYHGWSYELDGSLRKARDFGDDPGLDPDDFGLLPIQVGEWCGLIWVNLSVEAPALLDDLGPFAAEADGFPVEEYRFSHEVVHDLACNWKTYVDNYLEGYHVPFLHPELNRELDMSTYRVDVRLDDRYCIHSAHTRDGVLSAGRWLFRWPNLALNLYPDGMNVERILPAGADRTTIVYTYYFCEPGTPEAKESERLSMLLMDEDKAMCEQVQANLDAGVYDHGRLSPRHEQGVAQFQALWRAALDA